MITIGIVTNEKRLMRPFEHHRINDSVTLLVSRCKSRRRVIRHMKRAEVCGYISAEPVTLPLRRYDGSGIFCTTAPRLVKKLLKSGCMKTESAAIITAKPDEGIRKLIDLIIRCFRDFYIVAADSEFAADTARYMMEEYGVYAEAEEPDGGCDVEIVVNGQRQGLGGCSINADTHYEIKHGYTLPCEIDSRAFTEALYENGLLTDGELEALPIAVKEVNLFDKTVDKEIS